MPIISSDPFDVRSQDEIKALVDVVFCKIKDLIKLKYQEANGQITTGQVINYIQDLVFPQNKVSNKLDKALVSMGIGMNDDKIVDDLSFVREFFVRYFDTTEEAKRYLLASLQGRKYTVSSR